MHTESSKIAILRCTHKIFPVSGLSVLLSGPVAGMSGGQRRPAAMFQEVKLPSAPGGNATAENHHDRENQGERRKRYIVARSNSKHQVLN
jgi:hypothetical protein